MTNTKTMAIVFHPNRDGFSGHYLMDTNDDRYTGNGLGYIHIAFATNLKKRTRAPNGCSVRLWAGDNGCTYMVFSDGSVNQAA